MFNRNVAIYQETQYTVFSVCQVTDRNMFLVISTSQSCQDIHDCICITNMSWYIS